MAREKFRRDGKLDLVWIAGGEMNLNACVAGALRRAITRREMDIWGLATLICAKRGDIGPDEVKYYMGVVDAIQGQRLGEVRAEDVRSVFSAIGLKRKDYLYLPLIEVWKERLVKEMAEQGRRDFSDYRLREYMAKRILDDLCKK